jgi:membrane protease YdiL (CAAX protease family)
MLGLALARFLTSAWFPAPPPETEEQSRWAQTSLARRLRAAGLATLAVGAVVMGLNELRFYWLGSGRSEPDSPWWPLVSWLPLIIVVTAVARVCIKRRESVGLQWSGAATSCALCSPVLLLDMLDVSLGGSPDVAQVLAALALGATVGCVEELFGRGVLVTVLGGARHLALSVVLGSILFAYLHMPLYVHWHGFEGAVLRCAGSSAFSATLALIRLRSGSLVGPIFFHAINNTQGLFRTTPKMPPEMMVIGPKLLIVGSVLTAIYWVACRRAIKRSLEREVSPGSRQYTGAAEVSSSSHP